MKKTDFESTPNERIAQLEWELENDPSEIEETDIEEMLDVNLE